MREQKTGQRLILADGTELEDSYAGYAEGFLWCYLRGLSMAEAGALFLDPEKTAEIIFQYGEMEDVYDGMTDCRILRMDPDGMIAACMAKGGGANG